MAKYTIEWNDTRTVWSEVEAKTEKDAINKLMEGKGKEVNWSGSDTPVSEKDIEKITKGE